MRILLAASLRAFGSEQESNLQTVLKQELLKQGHTVDSFALPYVEEALSMPEQAFAIRGMDVSDCDLLITIGFPALMLQHANKYSFLFDAVPRLMEYLGTEYGMLSSPQYQNIAQICETLLRTEMEKAKKVFCASELLKRDVIRKFGISCENLPLMNCWVDEGKAEKPIESSKYIIAETVYDVYERNEWMVDALPSVKEQCRLVLYTQNNDEQFKKALYERADRLQVRDRLEIRDGKPSVKMIGQAAGVLSIPYQARRIPQIVMKALRNGVPVITTNDSGALLEVLKANENGMVAEPDYYCEELAQAVDTVCMGTKKFHELEIKTEKLNWNQIIEEMVRQ